MGDYHVVEEELARGTPPDVLCATCPWDRLCIEPPAITRQEIDRQVKEAMSRDEAGGDPNTTQGLITAFTLGGRDQMGTLCPVFALKLTAPEGRTLADKVRALIARRRRIGLTW